MKNLVWISSQRRSILAFSLPLLLYLLTLAPTIYNLDSAELTTAAATGGITRATGYPLYLMLGYLWTHLPLGDVGFRMNLFSAFAGALTIFLAERILRRWEVGAAATFGALGLLATAPFFWGMSLIAEVYTLHTVLMALLVLLLLRWGDKPSPRNLGLVGLVAGLGLAHHAATLLLAPGALIYVLLSHPRQALRGRWILAAALGLAIGLAAYLYLPLRHAAGPAFNYAGHYDTSLNFIPVDLRSLDGFLWLVTGKAFTGQMLAYHGQELLQEAWLFLHRLGQAFFLVGVGPGLLGGWLLFRKEWRAAGMLTLMFLFSSAFYIDYRVIDKDTMFLPSYLVWALWVGVGYQGLLDWLRQHKENRLEAWGEAAFQGLMIAGVLLACAWNWRLVDLSKDRSARQRGEQILQQVEPGAIVFGWWDTVPVIEYLQQVEGMRPDVRAISRFLISPQDLFSVVHKEVPYRAIYIENPPTELLDRYAARQVGTLYRLYPGVAP